jgi:hypothetical protein
VSAWEEGGFNNYAETIGPHCTEVYSHGRPGARDLCTYVRDHKFWINVPVRIIFEHIFITDHQESSKVEDVRHSELRSCLMDEHCQTS